MPTEVMTNPTNTSLAKPTNIASRLGAGPSLKSSTTAGPRSIAKPRAKNAKGRGTSLIGGTSVVETAGHNGSSALQIMVAGWRQGFWFWQVPLEGPDDHHP